MSPTPPETEQVDCNSNITQVFQHDHGGIQANAIPDSFDDSNKKMSGGDDVLSGHHESSDIGKVKNAKQTKCSTKAQPVNGTVKKRGRPPKVKTEVVPSKQSKITDTLKKVKRTNNRFKGVSKEELMERLLPDRIKHDLDILIIGINPGLFAAYKGHHYAGPGNHFWSCINLSGFVDRKMTSDNDIDLLNYGIGFSTIVQRTTPGAKDLSTKEIKEGAKKLIEKIQFYRPKIAVFNGKGIYEIFSKEIFGQKKKDFVFGTQQNKIPDTDTFIYVMPSSSARCAQFPRAQDKVHFYVKLKQLRDDIRGIQPDSAVREVGYSFNLEKATELAKIHNIKQERFDPEFDAVAAGQNGQVIAAYPVFGSSNTASCSNATANVKQNGIDQTDNGKLVQITAPKVSITPDGVPNTNMKQQNLTQKEIDENSVAARHTHLVKYLRQEIDDSEPGPSNRRKGGIIMPTSLSPGNPKLQEDVSEEQRQERVGNWVREQQSLEYDSEPPMGMERREEETPRLQDRGLPPRVEIDGASQLSALSAGVSGSASESTSGYGSIDVSSRRVRLDRVEMWVMEQQHVGRNNQHSQVMQSIQAASNHNQIPSSGHNRSSPNPTSTFQQNLSQTIQGHTVQGSSVTQTLPGQSSLASRNTQRVGALLSTHVATATDQIPCPSGSGSSAERTPPYFMRRRDGESGSSFGASIRPPVPLYSSWGGGESSGGSGISSPAVMFPTTQPSPVQPYVIANTSASNPHSSIVENSHGALPMTWQTTQSSTTLMANNFNS